MKIFFNFSQNEVLMRSHPIENVVYGATRPALAFMEGRDAAPSGDDDIAMTWMICKEDMLCENEQCFSPTGDI